MGGSSTSSSYGAGMGGYGAGMGGMSASKTSPPPPPVFKAPKKSSGPAFDFGALFSGIKDIASPKAIGAIVAILFAGLLLYATQFGLSFGVAGKKEYAEVKEIFGKLEYAMAKGGASGIATFAKENESKLASLKKAIEGQNPGADKRLLQLMLFATRDHIPNIVKGDATAEARMKTLKDEMAEAARIVGESPASSGPVSPPSPD